MLLYEGEYLRDYPQNSFFKDGFKVNISLRIYPFYIINKSHESFEWNLILEVAYLLPAFFLKLLYIIFFSWGSYYFSWYLRTNPSQFTLTTEAYSGLCWLSMMKRFWKNCERHHHRYSVRFSIPLCTKEVPKWKLHLGKRCFNVDICWNNVVTSVNVIWTLNQRHVVNFDSMLKLTLKKRWLWVDTRSNFVDNLQCWWNYDNHILT